MQYTTEEVKTLAAFYSRYPEGNRLAYCEHCHKQVPAASMLTYPGSIDEETGMEDETEQICPACMESIAAQQQETDEGYEPGQDYENDYGLLPGIRPYPPVECPWTEQMSWGR